MGNKQKIKSFKYLSLVGQFGLSLAVPPVMCVLIAVKLQSKFGLGDWVLICAVVVGLISSAMTFFKFIKSALNDNTKNGGDDDEKN